MGILFSFIINIENKYPQSKRVSFSNRVLLRIVFLDVVVSPPASEFDYCKHVFNQMWRNPLGSTNIIIIWSDSHIKTHLQVYNLYSIYSILAENVRVGKSALFKKRNYFGTPRGSIFTHKKRSETVPL